MVNMYVAIPYIAIAEKFGKFGESSVIRQTKTVQIVLVINNLLGNLFIRQTFFRQRLNSPNIHPRQNFRIAIRYCIGLGYLASCGQLFTTLDSLHIMKTHLC